MAPAKPNLAVRLQKKGLLICVMAGPTYTFCFLCAQWDPTDAPWGYLQEGVPLVSVLYCYCLARWFHAAPALPAQPLLRPPAKRPACLPKSTQPPSAHAPMQPMFPSVMRWRTPP